MHIALPSDMQVNVQSQNFHLMVKSHPYTGLRVPGHSSSQYF